MAIAEALRQPEVSSEPTLIGVFGVVLEAFAEGALSAKSKELIAFAVAHAIQCPYCIDVHAKAASSAGATREEMAEALHVAAVTRGGASLVHGVQALQSLDED
jgi:AhpD family alkylhydroperoxidase